MWSRLFVGMANTLLTYLDNGCLRGLYMQEVVVIGEGVDTAAITCLVVRTDGNTVIASSPLTSCLALG